MTSPIDTIVQSIADSRSAQIKLTTIEGKQLNLHCIYRHDEAPCFLLIFAPGVLPANIDMDERHPLSIRQDDSVISLSTTVIEQRDDRTLYLMARTTVDPASLREYFRVNTCTTIVASYQSGHSQSTAANWTIKGQTQDLSASGVLALFPEEPLTDHSIFLEILLPPKNVTICSLGHVVKKKRLRSKRWQVAFQFNNISNKNRDSILSFLLSEQRKQLREKINVAD